MTHFLCNLMDLVAIGGIELKAPNIQERPLLLIQLFV